MAAGSFLTGGKLNENMIGWTCRLAIQLMILKGGTHHERYNQGHGGAPEHTQF